MTSYTVLFLALAQGSIWHGQPPSEFLAHKKVTQLEGPVGDVKGQVEIDSWGPETTNLVFRWKYPAPGQYTPPQLGRNKQIESTAYWPTDILAVGDVSTGDTSLVVAGKRPNDNTVIEVWKLDLPQPKPPQTDSSGQTVYPPYYATISRRVTVYDAAVVGRDMVYMMLRKCDTSDKLLLQFWDSRDIYEFSFLGPSAGQLTLLFTASPSSGQVPVIPELDQPRRTRYSGDHTLHGYTYLLLPGLDQTVASSALALFDHDRDGTIEDFMVLTPPLWESMGFDTLDSWTIVYH